MEAASRLAAGANCRGEQWHPVCGSGRGGIRADAAGAWRTTPPIRQEVFDVASTRCDGAAAPLYGGLRLNSDVGLVHAQSVGPSPLTPTAGVRNTLTANGSSATGPVECSSWCWTSRPRIWTLLREYSRERIIDWTPPAAGIYVVPALDPANRRHS